MVLERRSSEVAVKLQEPGRLRVPSEGCAVGLPHLQHRRRAFRKRHRQRDDHARGCGSVHAISCDAAAQQQRRLRFSHYFRRCRRARAPDRAARHRLYRAGARGTRQPVHGRRRGASAASDDPAAPDPARAGAFRRRGADRRQCRASVRAVVPDACRQCPLS